MPKPKINWMDGAGLVPKNSSGTDEFYEGASDSDESGVVKVPSHLVPDSQLESFIKETQDGYAKDYDTSWGPYFHGDDNYPAAIVKTKGGKKVVGD